MFMKTKFKKGMISLGFISALILLTIVIVFSISNFQSFKVTTYKIDTDKNVNNLRIVFVSDLHLKEYGKNNIDLVNAIKNLNPDLIVIGGDSIIYKVDEYSSAINFINEATQIAPTYFSLGNHEWAEIYDRKKYSLLDDLQSTDAIYLENNMIQTNIKDMNIVICGIIDSVKAEHSLSDSVLNDFNNEIYNDSFKLLLSHRPTMISYTNITPKADLILSGHEHGGQVIIPFTKQGLYSRNQGFLPKYTNGAHIIENNLVIISTGLSNSDLIVPRVNNQPELVVIDVN